MNNSEFNDNERATALAAKCDRQRVDKVWKGFPRQTVGRSPQEIAPMRKSVLSGDFPMPVATLRKSALDQNIRVMKEFVDASGVALCPHGKTTMSPELFAQQLAAGAWGMTAATAHHVSLYRSWGVGRILLANQLIASADIDIVIEELTNNAFEFFCLVDSHEGVERLSAAVRRSKLPQPLNVIIEVGATRARTGVRSIEEGIRLGEQIAKNSEALALRGVEIFEGVFPSDGQGPDATKIMLENLGALAKRLLDSGLFAPGEIIITGGGSALFDLCVNHLTQLDLDGRAKIVLRSGCYITHDHGIYAHALEVMRARQPETFTTAFRPQPALEIWGIVQSTPEPGFAVISLGKRDVGFDMNLPQPVWHYRDEAAKLSPAPKALRISSLYDQHACLDGADDLSVGDLVSFGISHPCTTFDKWRAIPVVDDDYFMIDFVTTFF